MATNSPIDEMDTRPDIYGEAWEAGWEAGRAGHPMTPPPDAPYRSWLSGWLDGRHVRDIANEGRR